MMEFNKENFQEEVLDSKGLVLVDYWGEGCEPCRALMPTFDELSAEYEGRVKFGKLNTTQERRLALSQRVLGLPTIVLYKDGSRVGECIKNDASREGIVKILEAHL